MRARACLRAGTAPGNDRRRTDGRASGILRHALAALPQGQLLPDRSWRRRHRCIVALLWLHVLGLFCFGMLEGVGLPASATGALGVAAAAVFAGVEPLGRRTRSLAASFGLVSCSALVVYMSGGVIEAHFHFFVVLSILVLYQDWAAFLLALAYVVVHHGLLGALVPAAVYNHPAAVAHPWKWAMIHGAFVLAASAANLVSWRANEQMLHEPLTGLAGRAVFLHRTQLALDRLRKSRTTLAVLFLDLDSFKMLNDTLGHAAGDQLLVATAERLKRAARRTDTVARVGGDEFAVLCEDIESEEVVAVIAERIKQAIGRPYPLGRSEVATDASIGIAFTASPETTPDELMANADTAMYHAKARRGQRYFVFDETIRRAETNRLATEIALRQALAREELRVFYQPIVSRSEGLVVGAEALLRWKHPDRGIVPPADFIPIAEQTGLIIPIGRWVLEQACQEAVRWSAGCTGRPRPYVTVNLSVRQFSDPSLVDTVADVLDRTGLDPAQLGLEITESALMEEIDSPLDTLLALKRIGVRLLLDDFGTGYSSLAYLRTFPIDVLKVDRSFIADLNDQAGDAAILGAVVGMAGALGISVVAEGVEAKEQLSRLTLLGYDLAQGYYFARPGPAAEVRGLFADTRLAIAASRAWGSGRLEASERSASRAVQQSAR
jgi:diguanylate cyclase (GGDEF)-like protein